MKKLIFAGILILANFQVQASWFDFLTGSDDKADQANETNEVSESSIPSNSTADMVNTGLSLLPMLTQTLGVTNTQAEGGLGALLVAAQELLANGQFNSIMRAIPNSNSLLSAVTKTSGSSSKGGLLDSAMELAGNQGGAVGAGANLISQFSSLGMDSGMITKFANVTGDYLKQSNKTDEANTLTSTIAGLF